MNELIRKQMRETVSKMENVGDTISRQAAIDAVEGVDWYHINRNGELVKGANSREDEPLYKAKDIYDAIENVKPVQPGGWLEQNKGRILQAGKKGREVEIRIGGRLFAIREKAQ